MRVVPRALVRQEGVRRLENETGGQFQVEVIRLSRRQAVMKKPTYILTTEQVCFRKIDKYLQIFIVRVNFGAPVHLFRLAWNLIS